MVEDDRVARLEAEVRRSVVAQKIFEEQLIAREIATVVTGGLKQLAQTYDEQLDGIRRIIDGLAALQADSVRTISDLSETYDKLATRTDRHVGLQQQQTELNEAILEAIEVQASLARSNGEMSYGKEASIDVEIDLLEETMVTSVGSCGIEAEEGEETCVVCGIEEEAGLHPSSGSEDANMANMLQNNESKGATDNNSQGSSLGCDPISISVRHSSSSSSCDPNTHQLRSSRSLSIFDSPLESIFRQGNSIRSGDIQERVVCGDYSMVQK
jgi:hypothetical protein